MDTRRDRPRTLHATSTEWVLARRPAPFILEEPRPRRPHTLLLLDGGLGLVLGVESVEPDASAAEAAQWAADIVASGETMLPAEIRVRKPRKLRVEDPDLADAVATMLGPGISVRVAPAPEADKAMESLAEFSDRGPGRSRALPEPTAHASSEAVAAFFRAAAAFYRAAPWKLASDSEVLQVDAPGLGMTGACAVILGNAEHSYGLLLYRSLVDYLEFIRRTEDPGKLQRDQGPGVATFSIFFDHPSDIPGGRKLSKQAKARGWELAGPRAFPWLVHVTADGVPLPGASDDYRRAAASLRAIAAFMEGHRSLFEGEASDPVREAITVRELPGEADVAVTAPLPDSPWRWGEETSLEGLRRTEAEAARDLHLAARREAGASEEEVHGTGSAITELIEFAVFHAEEPLSRWTPELVAEYLVEYYPRKGSVSGDEIDGIPGYLGAFFEWLGKSGQLPQTTATAIRRRIGRERASFLRAARDPARFGPAKAVVATMQREGVDIEDEAAVHRFLEDFNRRLEKDPELLPMPDFSRFLGPSKKWVWNGEGPAPDPVASCPCGSGRRYRKCCMQR